MKPKKLQDNISKKFDDLKLKILWTNPDPNSYPLTEYNITLSSSDYDILEVFYAQITGSDLVYSSRFLKGCSTRMRIDTPDSDNIFRGLTYVDDKTYRYDLVYTSTSFEKAEKCCIPLYIIGYKTGLFE